MLKKFIFITTCFCSITAVAQVSLLHVDFDSPHAMRSYSAQGANLVTWRDTNTIVKSGSTSLYSKVIVGDTVYLETPVFSTKGMTYVSFSFEHICKIHGLQRAYVQVSTDSGSTWVNLTGNNYFGNSLRFKQVNFFNEWSYNSKTKNPYWGGITTPTSNVLPDNTWWAKETFDLSSIAGQINSTTGDTGFANVKVRWVLDHNGAPSHATGWFLDDIEIIGATIEQQPPEIDWNLVPYQKPEGPRYQLVETIRLKVKDARAGDKGIEKVEIHFSINNAPWVTDSMIQNSIGPCVDTSIYTYIFTGLSLNDTVHWYVEAFDCTRFNSTRDPSIGGITNYNTFWVTIPPPLNCGPATPNSWPKVISLFPWLEDFESSYWAVGSGSGDIGNMHRGTIPAGNPPYGQNWTVYPAINSIGYTYGWSVRKGPTGTAQTGPSSNHTPGGKNYLFAEASQGNYFDITQLITPCLDLSGLSHPALEFYYHMYGSDINGLRIDIDTGTTSPNWVNLVIKFVGQQQISSFDPWNRAYVSLEDYAGKIIRVRFVSFRGNGEKGDVAIDDIRVYEPVSYDGMVLEYFTPENGGCDYSSNEDVSVRLEYIGRNDITEFPVAFATKHLNSGVTVTTWDTIKKNITGGFDSIYIFPVGANLSAQGEYHISVFCSVPGDTVTSNDTIGPFYIHHETPYTNFPYFCTFDDAPWAAGDGTNNNSGSYDTSLFKLQHDPASATNMSWYVGTNFTRTSNTGPRRDLSYSGNYLYTEASNGSNVRTEYYTNCIDLGTMVNPMMSFWYHMYGTSAAAILVQVKEAGSNTWENIIPNANVFAPQQTSEMDQWIYHRVDLSGYAGTVVKLRIVGARTNSGSTADIAIDDLFIYDQPTLDVGITHILHPNIRVNLTNPVKPTFYIRNYGTTPVSNIPIEYTITPLCGPNSGVPKKYTTSYTGTIPPNSEVYKITNTAPPYPLGTFSIAAKTLKFGDAISLNDSLYSTLVGQNFIHVATTYLNDFESCSSGLEDGFFNDGDLHLFEIVDFSINPNANIDSSYSGNNCMVLQLESASKTEILKTPIFSGFDSISAGLELHFKHNFNFPQGSGGTLEFFNPITASWEPFDLNPNVSWCNNLYNSNSVQVFNSKGWEGKSNGWVDACVPLSFFEGTFIKCELQFKAEKPSEDSVLTWAIDDFEIRIAEKYNLRTNTLELTTIPTVNSGGFNCDVRVANLGYKEINQYYLVYSIDGVVKDSLHINRSNKVGYRENVYDQLPVAANLTAGKHKLCVWTSLPNGHVDTDKSNDTTRIEFEVVPNLALPACVDFEGTSKFYPHKTLFSSIHSAWELGYPTKTNVSGVYSGINCWVTYLSKNYSEWDGDYLYTNEYSMVQDQCYELSFQHNYGFEHLFDGGNVEYTLDYGKTWKVLESLKDSLWYNKSYVHALGLNVPGFTGNSLGWQQASAVSKFNESGNVIFRFNFKTNSYLNDEGWAIDDVCFKKVSSLECSGIGLNENRFNRSIYAYPNPAKEFTHIYLNSIDEDVQLKLLSMDGKIQLEQLIDAGTNKSRVELTGLSAGIYLLEYNVGGTFHYDKLVIQ